MSTTANVYRIITNKDIMNLLECSENHAKKIKNDIKEELKVPIVLLKHFNEYLKI